MSNNFLAVVLKRLSGGNLLAAEISVRGIILPLLPKKAKESA